MPGPLLLSLHSLEKELHLKHTPWCDCRSTTHRNGYAGQGSYAAQGKIFCSISQALWGRALVPYSYSIEFVKNWAHDLCFVCLTYRPSCFACWFNLQKTFHLCIHLCIDHKPPQGSPSASSSWITATTFQLLYSQSLVLFPLVCSTHCSQHDLYKSSLFMSRTCNHISCQIKSKLAYSIEISPESDMRNSDVKET